MKWIVIAILLASVSANVLLWNTSQSLRKEKARLMVIEQEATLLRDQVAEVERLRTANQEVEKLRRDNQELARLRNEARQFREQAPEMEKLRNQTAELTRQLAEARQSLNTQQQSSKNQIAAVMADQASAQEKARSVQCINNLKQLALAARLFANDNNEAFPPDILAMAEAIANPKILVCPSDPLKVAVEDWQQFNPSQVSYQFLLPNASAAAEPNRILFQCLVHGNVAHADGSAQMAQKP